MNLPGTSLLALSRRYLNADVVESTVVPTIADLQHETLDAGDNTWRRGLAVARGYGAIIRIMFWDGLIWRFPMRRPLTVLALGGVGAALVLGSVRLRPSGFISIDALLLMAVVTPVVFRLLNVGGSYRQMLANCIGVGMLTATASYGWIVATASHGGIPWYGYGLSYSFVIGCVVLGSVLAAAAAWTPSPGAEPVYRLRLLDVVAGAATFASPQP